MDKPLVIAFCGSTTRIRNEIITNLMSTIPGMGRNSVPTSIRAPWRRFPALEAKLADRDCPTICEIHTREESELIERLGGVVVHVEGIPSADVPINRADLLVTRALSCRGRYLTIPALIDTLNLAPEAQALAA